MTAVVATDFFSRWVRERLFVPESESRQSVGLEVELLPLLSDSGLPCPLRVNSGHQRSTLAFVRHHGAGAGWQEQQSSKGAPYFALPNGGRLTFEPGGQLELCTPPRQSMSQLLGEARRTLAGLRRCAADAGIELVSVGIDPRNDVAAVPLQIESERYVRMTHYFDQIGPSGVRMMRQTAATQVSLDGGADPAARWRLLCDLAPYLTAIFANSPRYACADTGWASFRAQCWRSLDPTRTGVPDARGSSCETYTRFALDAVHMWRTTDDGVYLPFVEWVANGAWSERQWDDHVSTLFPEVRPRGYLEVRSIDALGDEQLGAPVVLLMGLIYDRETFEEARRLLAPGDEQLLNDAARCGLRDQRIAETAVHLVELGIHGARCLGDERVGGEEIERATQFFRDFTFKGRSPGDVV